MTKRRSIHIGLNIVDPQQYGGWDGALAGCVNDANAMQEVAVSRGFDPKMLLNADATAEAVRATWTRLPPNWGTATSSS